MAYTSIQIQPKTREKLSELKFGPRETYDELINKLLALVPAGNDEGEYTDEFRVGLLNARLESLHGKGISHEQAKKIMGL